VTAWERALALAPNADEALRLLGVAALREGDRGRARCNFSRAVEANPNNVQAHIDLAELLTELGETRAAVAHWDEAEMLFPNHPRLLADRELREAAARQVDTCCGPVQTAPDEAHDHSAADASAARGKGPAGP
jgi:tetratricopeptide (TPR) repeat protein